MDPQPLANARARRALRERGEAGRKELVKPLAEKKNS
jgi:hypothetical protein